MHVPVESGLDLGDSDTFLLGLLLLPGIDDEFENMSAHFECGTEASSLLDIGTTLKKSQVASDETRSGEGEIELIIGVIIDQRSKIEPAIMDDTKNCNQVVENQILILLVPSVLNQYSKESIKDTADLLDYLDFRHKQNPLQSVQHFIDRPFFPIQQAQDHLILRVFSAAEISFQMQGSQRPSNRFILCRLILAERAPWER
ncbi:hypothetical protein AWENTII_012998 [Aspergillus wentii]